MSFDPVIYIEIVGGGGQEFREDIVAEKMFLLHLLNLLPYKTFWGRDHGDGTRMIRNCETSSETFHYPLRNRQLTGTMLIPKHEK